jgi:hypothetical protein
MEEFQMTFSEGNSIRNSKGKGNVGIFSLYDWQHC